MWLAEFISFGRLHLLSECVFIFKMGTNCTQNCIYFEWSKMWKILEEMGIPDHLTCLLRNMYAGQETTVLEQVLDMEQQISSKLGKEYVKAVNIVTLLI